MSTSVVYRALGIRGDKHQSIREQDGSIVMRVRHEEGDLTCPQCGGANVVRQGERRAAGGACRGVGTRRPSASGR